MSNADRLAQLRTRLQQYYDAEEKILKSQEYTIGGADSSRKNRRAELDSVRAGIKDCETQIAQLETTLNPRSRRVIQIRPRH